MANKVIFDWDNLLIIVKPGITEIDVEQDLYSDWKEEVQLADNSKYPIAFRSVGGDPISGTQDLGSTFFLLNGWTIRPQEADHQLDITGNLFTDPAGNPLIVPTLGDFTVLVNTFVSNLVDAQVARLDLVQLLQSVYIDVVNGEAGTDEGIGTPTRPVNNIADAFTIASRDNLFSYHIRGDITLDRDYLNWTFIGAGEINSELTFGGWSINGSSFKGFTLTGTMTGRAEFAQCDLENITGLDAHARSCGLGAGTLSLANNAIIVLSDCYSEVAGTNTPIVSYGTNCTVNLRNYSGGIQINNHTAGCITSLGLDPGHGNIHSSSTGGTIVVRGVGQLTDNSAGATIITEGLVLGSDVALSRKVLTNRIDTDPGTGILTLYDDDGTPLQSAQLYEDVGGGQTYRGQGAERRDKLS